MVKVCLPFLLILLSACSATTVHLNTRYLQPEQTLQLTKMLEEKGYKVQPNQLPLPNDLTVSSIIYSPHIRDSNHLKVLSAELKEAGWPVKSLEFFNRDNHWYTRDSFGLFLIPEDVAGAIVTSEKLSHQYASAECTFISELKLSANGLFQLDVNEPEKMAIKGTWKITQYPYMEIRWKSGQYWTSNYLQIMESERADAIGKVRVIKLKPLNQIEDLAGCVFVYGVRN